MHEVGSLAGQPDGVIRQSQVEHVSGESVEVIQSAVGSVSGPVTAAFTLPAAFALGFDYAVGRAFTRILGCLCP